MPKPVARATDGGRWSPSTRCISSFDTNACTAPESPKPRTSAQSVTQNMKKPSHRLSPTSPAILATTTPVTDLQYTPWGYYRSPESGALNLWAACCRYWSVLRRGLGVVGIAALVAMWAPPAVAYPGAPWFEPGKPYNQNFPDPSVLRVGDTYYAYGTATGGSYLPVMT